MDFGNGTGHTPSPPCLSHRFERQSNIQTGTICFYFCKYCGLAWSPATDALLRPSRFDQITLPQVSPQILYKNALTGETRNRPKDQRFVDMDVRNACVRNLKMMFHNYYFLESVPDRAVAIMDYYLSSVSTHPQHYMTIMRASLTIACKMDEKASADYLIERVDPQIAQLCLEQELLPLEHDIMKALSWNANLVTSRCVANLILWQGVATKAEISALCQDCPTFSQFVVEYILKLVDCILDTTLNNFSFYRYKPSGIAAAAIALSREMVGLRPWTRELESITGFEVDQINHCLQVMREMKNSLSGESEIHKTARWYHQEKRLFRINIEAIRNDYVVIRANAAQNAANDIFNTSIHPAPLAGEAAPLGMPAERVQETEVGNQPIPENEEVQRRVPPRHLQIRKKNKNPKKLKGLANKPTRKDNQPR